MKSGFVFPIFLAHHYTEAGLLEETIGYWQQAGRRAIERSAHVEALGHLSQGMTLLATLPSTPVRSQHALTLQLTLAATLMKTRGYAAPEVEQAYGRARELCRQVGESPQMARVLFGLWAFYMVRAQFQAARELGEQLRHLAQHQGDPALLMMAHHVAGITLLFQGEFAPAQGHLADSAELYRLKGELLLQMTGGLQEAAEAAACLRQALAIARRQHAKGWELRVAISLSRLWRRQGKCAQARQLLAEIYGWFTEGFDTADLQEAKTLLTALA